MSSATKEKRKVTSEESTFAVGKRAMETRVFCSMSRWRTRQGREPLVEVRMMLKMMLPERM